MASRRPLRLSMIASAHVFTPRPSPDPQENLRVLQTPLRTPFAREQEEIVLVRSNTPRVVEEDKDLVILDEVEPEPEPVLPLPLSVEPQMPKTPVRRPPRSSLHRAVLIRSAQRAAIQREMQMEEEQELEEVEESIAAIAEAEESNEDAEEVRSSGVQQQPRVTGWRKSIDLVKGSLGWAFRGLSVEPKQEEDETLEHFEEEDEDYAEKEDDEGMEEDEEQDVDRNENYDQQAYDQEEEQNEEAEAPRPLGRFMTPQIPRTTSAKVPRLSLGAGPDAGPRRVRLVAPWKVSEIQVPSSVKEEEGSGPSSSTPAPLTTPKSPLKRDRLTEEEREAIRARRRSALATPDNFFKGQTPGSRRTLFPTLAPLPSPSFITSTETSDSPSQSHPASIKKETPPASVSATPSVKAEEEGEKEDTAVLLARMRQMVEGVKQRQSLGRQSLNLSPRKRDSGFSLLAPGHATAHAPSRILIDEDEPEGEGEGHDASRMDEDATRNESVTDHAPPPQQPRTPMMSDLRHVFGRAHAEPHTPALTGVRDMFCAQPHGHTETPMMDGVREILDTPAGYRPASPERREEDASIEEEEDEDEEQADVQAQATEDRHARGPRGKKAGPGASRRRPAVPVPQSAPAKSTRAASQTLEEDSEASRDWEDGRTARRTRARTADGAVGQASHTTTRAKTAENKPATPEPQGEQDKNVSQRTAARATRRTRQTTADSSTTSHIDSDAPAETKPARKRRGQTPTPAATTTTTRRGTRAKPIEVAEDDGCEDNLDSRPHGEAQAEEHPEAAPTATRARRGTRSRVPTGTVKEEEVEPSLSTSTRRADEGKDTGARTTRARRTPVPKQPTPSAGAGTTARTGARTRGSSVVATDPAAGLGVEPAIPEDKENTPEANDDEEHEDTKPAAATRSRGIAGKATRRTARGAVEASEEAPVTAAKTRAGRTRARS
ncbi:hypothetical protein BD414DRAFT_485866 [Trametes punicea]|nr:hypothetical protein BD414DRAFT_485866 [Trametes punicea]